MSLLEHGAYRRLMDHYYSTGNPLSTDVERLCRVCRAETNIELDAVAYVLKEFFELTESGYFHERIQQEIDIAKSFAEKASKAGHASAAKRQLGANSKSTSVESELQPQINRSQSQLHKKEKKEVSICAEPTALALVDDPVLITLPTNRPNQAYRVLQSHFDQFTVLYPAVDVPQELRGMAGWLIGNPKNAKTASGMPRFINAWLSKAQNRSKPNGHGKPTKNDNWLAGAAELADELHRRD